MARRKTYQKGSIALHRGQQTLRYYVFDENGSKQYKRVVLEGVSKTSSKKDLLKAAEPLMARVNEENNNPRKAKEAVTFKSFVNGLWATYQTNEGLKESTMYSYASITSNHLLPTFGEKLLREIKPADITAFFNKLRADEVSTKYALNIYGLLSTLFEVAYQYDVIESKPIRSKLHKPKHEAIEKPTLPLDKIKEVLSYIEPSYRLFFVVLSVTGVRVGEACAFRWLNLDVESRTLAITNSVWRGKLTTPKTKASERALRLPQTIVQMLSDYRQESAYGKDEDFIFCRADGKAFDPDHLRECVLYPAMDKAQIERSDRAYGFHIFRHTAGSIIYEKTGRMKLVQKALGHSREQTTSDIYIHVEQEIVAESVAIIAEELFADRSWFQGETTGLIN
jgi:integrase